MHQAQSKLTDVDLWGEVACPDLKHPCTCLECARACGLYVPLYWGVPVATHTPTYIKAAIPELLCRCSLPRDRSDQEGHYDQWAWSFAVCRIFSACSESAEPLALDSRWMMQTSACAGINLSWAMLPWRSWAERY